MENGGNSKRVKNESSGAKNLVLMGTIAVLVALSTTGVSLAIYHNSGDIYLDRSRPGFMPDEQEIEEENDKKEEEYDFSKNGNMTKEGIDEYLQNLEREIEEIKAYEKPFDGKVLSDEYFGIPVDDTVNNSAEAGT